MYTIEYIEKSGYKYIEVVSSNRCTLAKFCLSLGGRLSNLKFNNTQILADFKRPSNREDYASAVLFPFANRVKNGKYRFNSTDYDLELNEPENNNALHGLVYNKVFDLKEKLLTKDSAIIVLSYKDRGECAGFPFPFTIDLKYTLNSTGISLEVKVVNIGTKTFPFTLGWHPYFISSDLNKSQLGIKPVLKYKLDEQKIICAQEKQKMQAPFLLKEHADMDDTYLLSSGTVDLITPHTMQS